ncbi:phenylalanine--tRNA ligase subunit beta [Lapidilactobacillus mulanensis]|uniref:Phenylalanine--tRNA ligase beta subunit n=1 Tax=Lapidilactobacillus mulanensis TaxID=2485999 RepID=A0ABW4DQI3_9LACO|nr:phenylalanine--tRNA ligase subunit beta [Lapidilactobacillus mulanensis]
MKISYQWLNSFVNLQEIDPQKLADQVSLTGIEVAGVIAPDEGLKKIVVGHILSTQPHPDSDHLTLCQVDIGEDEPVQIVCGAPNVATDQYVIVALPNSRISGNVKIKRGKMRGQASEGMICSLQEIGFSDSVVPKEFQNGIYVFPKAESAGQPVFPLLGMDDRMIDFDITPNRADTLGMHGAAWEVGAMLHERPQFPEVEVSETGQPTGDLLKVSVSEKNLVPQYLLKVVQNVEIKPSPLWLQIRLWNNGIRPINNVVDVTNFVLLEYGQPLHAFDYDKLTTHEILVRRAQQEEPMVTLDGQTRTLTSEDLVITDGQNPVAIAGVMGGLSSEITADTHNVVLESAVFDGTSIRKTAQHHNLHTEASTRFEKGIDQGSVTEALQRAVQLLEKLANGESSQSILVGNQELPEEKQILMDPKRVNHVLGTEISVAEMGTILDDLGFGYELKAEKYSVTVPLRRWDIFIEADLIEEIARLHGYDKLPSTLPVGIQTVGGFNKRQLLIREVKQSLLANGLDEVISYALVKENEAAAFTYDPTENIELDWPMTQDHAVLRQNLISGLLNDLQYNLARKQSNVAIFEQGNIFQKVNDTDQPTEVPTVAVLWAGNVTDSNWIAKDRAVDFYDLKGVLTNLLKTLGLADRVTYVADQTLPELHPGRSAKLLIDSQTLGFIGEVHPSLQHDRQLPPTYVLQLNLQLILDQKQASLVSQSAAKYPAVERDLALIVDHQVTNSDISDLIKSNGGKYLSDVQIFDVFTGEVIGLKKKSLAYRLHFQNPAATLTDDQVTQAMDKIQTALQDQIDAQIR